MFNSPFCTPLCPFRSFYCTKRALVIKKGSRPEAWCAWIGDKCIGYRCQFASCTRHALMPDGRCKLLVRRESRRERPLEEEAESIEREMVSLKGKLKKLGLDIEKLE